MILTDVTVLSLPFSRNRRSEASKLFRDVRGLVGPPPPSEKYTEEVRLSPTLLSIVSSPSHTDRSWVQLEREEQQNVPPLICHFSIRCILSRWQLRKNRCKKISLSSPYLPKSRTRIAKVFPHLSVPGRTEINGQREA